LGERGFGWRLNPNNIVDLKSGIVLNSGPEIDLTRKGLDDLQMRAERLRQPLFEKSVILPEPPVLICVPQTRENPPVVVNPESNMEARSHDFSSRGFSATH
jgi:hypothetical protein